MTDYHNWRIYNHPKSTKPKGMFQVQGRDQTRIEAESIRPNFAENIVWPNVIAYRCVRET